ncbi:sugar ABC transporter substrate-binding protein [bacterium]|jgi:multiple sugar transport system substrate-binding protein|nr:sugar ABC transporter substrate-binding protein [bacterium]
MRHKRFLNVFAAVLLVFGVSSCARLQEDGQKSRVLFLTRATPEQLEVWRKAVNAFMAENPDVDVKINNLDYNSYWSKLQTMIAGGTPPDVVFLESYRLPAYALKGSLVDLSGYLENSSNIRQGDFFEKAYDLYKYGDKVYGIPNDIAVFCMFYNREIFDTYEVDYPKDDWTWDDFLDISQKLTVDTNGDGATDIYGFIYGYPFLWIWQNDAYLTDNPYNPEKITITSDNFIEALEFLADLRFKYRVVPSEAAVQAFNTGQFFTNGKVAMCVDGHWMVPYFKNNVKFDWDVAMLPRGKQRATLGEGSCFSICKGSKNPDAAWRLIEFLAGPKGQQIIVKEGFSTPALKEITKTDVFLNPPPKNKEAFIKSIPFGMYQPRIQGLSELENIFYRLHEQVVIDEKADIRALCEKYSKEMQEVLKNEREGQR